MTPKRILVTGTRYAETPAHVQRINQVLHDLWLELGAPKDAVLVHGGAPGADSIAAEAWSSNVGTTEYHPANWNGYGKGAGPIRNQKMVDRGADICVAFPLYGAENRGTNDCANRAKAAGIPTRTYELV